MIVRELVTKLAFNVDRRGLSEFAKNIKGIKSSITPVITAIAGTAAAILYAVQQTADLSIATDDLSRRSGVAYGDLIQLREAARQFRIDPSQFDTAFIRLTKDIEDARLGFGRLSIALERQGIDVKKANGEFKDTRTLFLEIGDILSKIPDEQDRLARFFEFFPEAGAGFEEFFRNGSKGVLELSDQFEGLGERTQEDIEKLKEYKRSVTNLSSEFGALTAEFSITVAPAVTQIVNGLTEIIRAGRKGDKEGFLSNLLNATEVSFRQVGIGGATTREIEQYKERQDFNRQVQDYINSRGIVNQDGKFVKIENNIEIEVPQGTVEEQKRVLTDVITEVMQTQSERMAQEVIDNYPEVE